MKLFALGDKQRDEKMDTLFDSGQEADIMRRSLIPWTQTHDSGCAGVLSLLDVTKCSFSVAFHRSLTKTPEQLMGASEKPINSNIPSTCLVMTVPILPQ